MNIQPFIFDMKTVRALNKARILLTDESLMDAGKRGVEAGKKLRETCLSLTK